MCVFLQSENIKNYRKKSPLRGWGFGNVPVLSLNNGKKEMNKQIEQLFKRHYRKMYLLAKVLLRDGDAAKDAVSDVFADMLDNNATVDSETAESFLLVCVRNKCLNTLDREKTRERAMTFIAGETESTEEAPERLTDKLESINNYLNSQLTPQTSQIIKMRYRQKLTYSEIAAALRISEAAVYKHIAQGIGKLKKQFNP